MACWVESPNHDRHDFPVHHRPALQATGGGLLIREGRPGQREQGHHEATGQAPGVD